MKKGKRYVESAKLVDRTNLYDVEEAVSIIKKTANAKFDETIEAHIKLGVDAVMLISRYVAQLYCLMVQVRRLEYLYLLRATK